MVDFWGIQKANKRKTLLIVVILITILCIIGYTVDYNYGDFYRLFGFDFPVATAIALVLGVGQSTWAYYWGDKAILATAGARPLDLSELREKQLNNVVEEMSIAAGVPMPFVYIIEQGGPNAFATGRDPMHASVAVTNELLNIMNREEIQGVIAHEMAHIRNRDTLTLTVTVALGGTILLLSDMARRMMYHGGGSRGRSSKDSGGGIVAIIGIILIILAPIIVRLLSMAVSRSREYAADAGGVEFTRNAMGLANALQKIDDYYTGKLDLSKFNKETVLTQKSKHLDTSPLDPLQLPIPVPPLGMPNKPVPPQNTHNKLSPEQNAKIDAMMQGYSDKDKYGKLAGLGQSLSADAGIGSYNMHNVDIDTMFSDYSSTKEAVAIDKESYGIASLYIYNPLDGALEQKEDWWSNLWETHPPIQKRISILTGRAKLQGMMKKNL